MTQNREKMGTTLELDYKGIDKQFKDQLIKTKACLHLYVLYCVGLMDRSASLPITIWKNIQKRSIMPF